MIRKVTFHRFKRFKDETFELEPSGVTLLAGGNNSGKSTVLHGLAIWQFCKLAVEMGPRPDAVVAGHQEQQGVGLGDDEFSPINVPSLEHLWTNLRSRKDTEPDGYTLLVNLEWGEGEGARSLEFGCALSNDRLFVKPTASSLDASDRMPTIAYLPPFAGITDREPRIRGALRRRRIGEGLAGAVLRNLLLDMYEANVEKRARLKEGRTKIRDQDLQALRDEDPWELLQASLREVFGAELAVQEFSEEYHSYISIDVVKGRVTGWQLKRYPKFNKRDLMVEGSGFLQWVSVYALALNPSIDVLLLDEPDAHLHCSLQDTLLSRLREVSEKRGAQIIVATHSTELLRHAKPYEILEVRSGRPPRYLSADHQKVGLFAGLGTEYAPRIDRLQRTKRLLFVEGADDERILGCIAEKLGVEWPGEWVVWRSPQTHRERSHLFMALQEEIGELVCVSLRDRDDDAIASVGDGLIDKHVTPRPNMTYLKWRRRHLENYLVFPEAVASVLGVLQTHIEDKLASDFGISVAAEKFTSWDAPPALLDMRGKQVLSEGPDALLRGSGKRSTDVARALPADAIADDLRELFRVLREIKPS